MKKRFLKHHRIEDIEIPDWIKWSYTLLAAAVLPVYWIKYGITNFLWFSDIAFFLMVPSLWFKNRLLASMMAIGVLPIETIWIISLCTGGAFLGTANYMYDESLPLWLRALSLFHFPMIMAVVYMIYRFGYDKRAIYLQILLSLFIISLTYSFTDKVDNVNMIFLPNGLQSHISPTLYSYLMPAILISCFITPTHLLLKKYARHRWN